MAEKKNETDHSPKNLAARITHKGDLDLNAVRDAIAAVLPRRWSEFALALEKMRFKNMQTSNSTIKGRGLGATSYIWSSVLSLYVRDIFYKKRNAHSKRVCELF